MEDIANVISNYGRTLADEHRLPSCPACRHALQERPQFYGCSNWQEGCTFKIWKTLAQKQLSLTHIHQLITHKKTDPIEGFISKKGSPFTAALILNEKYEVSFDFASSSKEVVGLCPLCQSDVHEKEKAYGCSAWKTKPCSFTIWKVIAGKTISLDIAKQILTHRRTELLSGFISKSGKVFAASLIITEAGKVEFAFPPR